MSNLQLQVCTIQEAEGLPGRPDWAVISITDPISAFGEAKLYPGWLAVHRVQFHSSLGLGPGLQAPELIPLENRGSQNLAHDADPSIDDPELHITMTPEDARGIVEFVRQYAPQVKGFMIHCNEGISRSQGVAAWIADTHHLPVFALNPGVSDTDFALDPRFNKHVFQLLKQEAAT